MRTDKPKYRYYWRIKEWRLVGFRTPWDNPRIWGNFRPQQPQLLTMEDDLFTLAARHSLLSLIR